MDPLEEVKMRDGRKVKPTPAYRKHLQEQADALYSKTYRHLKQLSQKLLNDVESLAPVEEVRQDFSCWSELFQAFYDEELNLRQFLADKELSKHDKRFSRRIDSLTGVRATLREYSAYAEEEDEGAGDASTLEPKWQPLSTPDRVTRLTAEIQRIQEDLAKTQLQVDNSIIARELLLNKVQPKTAPVTPSISPKTHAQIFRGSKSASSPRRAADSAEDSETDQSVVSVATTSCSDISTVDAIQKLAEVILSSNKRDRLPTMEPKVFDGDRLQYPLWINSFEALVESKADTVQEKLHYLGKYTSGSAYECIKYYLGLKTDKAYAKSKQVLADRYGDSFKLADSYRDKLRSWPVMKKTENASLQKFADFLWQCQTAMETIPHLNFLDTAEENIKLAKKLPTYLSDRWNRIVHQFRYRKRSSEEDGEPTPGEGYPSFARFCDFVTEEANIAEGPCNFHEDSSKKATHVKAFATTAEADKKAAAPAFTPKCLFCKQAHFLSGCTSFIEKDFDLKSEFIKKHGLCFGCFRRGHMCKDCTHRNPSLMIRKKKEKSETCLHTRTGIPHEDEVYSSSIVPVYIEHACNPGFRKLIYVILDSQSSGCFVDQELINAMNVQVEQVTLRLTTMSSTTVEKGLAASGLVITGLGQTTSINLPKCYLRDELPDTRECIPRPEEVMEWGHLREVADQLEPYHEEAPIALMLGFNCPDVFGSDECVRGQPGEPVAQRSPLGWNVMGCVSKADRGDHQVAQHFNYACRTRELMSDDLHEMFNREFSEIKSSKTMSIEDRRFLDQVESSLHQEEDGHFSLRLPFKQGPPILPDNRIMAKKSMESLHKKFSKNDALQTKYVKFMKDMIDSEHAELAPPRVEEKAGRYWCITHHDVINLKKPDKVRVVFNGKRSYKGHAINDHLLVGPDLLNTLVGILCRFRQGAVAVTCDIESMFYQVRVDEVDRDYLRFYWYKDSDVNQELVEYRMKVHLFGAASSPGCVNYVLKAVAEKYRKEHGDAAAEFVDKDFYMDDGIKSVNDTHEALDLIENSHRMCLKGGFRLCKYVSNDPEVVVSIPEELKTKKIQDLDLSRDLLPVERTLGVYWCMQTDIFKYKLCQELRQLTRRSMLSYVSSVFDPLGLISPVLLTGKQMVQEMCRDKKDWDDPISESLETRWHEWSDELPRIEDLAIPRCYRSNNKKIESVELHHFSDASTVGYGACSYLRIVDEDGEAETSLVMSKAHVAPSKAVTVPRLELQAAVLATKLAGLLQEELSYPDMKNYFWTDSMIVLGYIKNESKHFQIFVSNRVQKIRDASSPDQWSHVRTHENPADLASRGCSVDELSAQDLWWKGPGFIRGAGIVQRSVQRFEVKEDDPEVKKATVLNTKAVEVQRSPIMMAAEKSSSWNRLITHVCIWRRYCQKLKEKILQRKALIRETTNNAVFITAAERNLAERLILHQAQAEAYPQEMAMLTQLSGDPDPRESSRERKDILKPVSSLYKLDVYADKWSVLRVGGRLRRANLPRELQHPKILPKRHAVTRLVLQYYHVQIGHAGRNSSLNAVRARGYWIVAARSTINHYLSKCVTCKLLRAKPIEPRMSDLPVDRVSPSPPFTYSAVDLAGPFLIKCGRAVKKRWICQFVCQVIRALHLEVVPSLTTDSFLQAYRRFVCRRGPIKSLRCDQGTNFVGAKSELEAALNQLNQNKIQKKLSRDGCDWIHFKFNVPKASHMGGSWERLIGAAKRAREGLLVQHGERLDDEALQTLVVETESIVNQRPLTYLDTQDVDADVPITPQLMLTMKHQVLDPPPGVFVPEDIYCRKRWRTVQYLAGQFWVKWQREYLPTLQERKKWGKHSNQ